MICLFHYVKLNKRQKIQIDAYLNNKITVIDKKGVQAFLKSFKYPVYHLDFESYQIPIPPSDDAWPYEQISTQYSLHIEYEDGRLEHKRFLGDSIDPRREIADSLCKNIPVNACVTAYNKVFECGRLNELADLYPDLRDHLSSVSSNVVDLVITTEIWEAVIQLKLYYPLYIQMTLNLIITLFLLFITEEKQWIFIKKC